MNSIILTRVFRLLILIVLQVLVFNNIHLFGYITPLVIGYMVVCFHRNTSQTEILIWGFVTGFISDLFSNTAGMGAASCTLIAMIQPYWLNLLAPRDSADDFTPTITTMGFWNYILYVILLMVVMHGCFYLLDAFTLYDWFLTILSIAGGAVLSTLIILFIELMIRARKNITTH